MFPHSAEGAPYDATGAPVRAFVNGLRAGVPYGSDYVSEVTLFTGEVPENYLPLNGQTLAVRDNVALYSLLGARYGGNGVTTCQIPRVEQRANGQWVMCSTDCAFPQRP